LTSRHVDPIVIDICTYVSLNNEITIKDIAEGLDRAFRNHPLIKDEAQEFDAIVHSTGMLVLRSWLTNYGAIATANRRLKRLKHLIGLAPATWGSPRSARRMVEYKSFLYQAASWKKARRVVAKVEHHQGELFPRVGFIVTSLNLPSEGDVSEKWHRESCPGAPTTPDGQNWRFRGSLRQPRGEKNGLQLPTQRRPDVY
jgi:hypothetical protein